MFAPLETAVPRKRDPDRDALARSPIPRELEELHSQIREVRQQLGALDDKRGRRQRRQSRVEHLTTDLAVAEEQANEARAAAVETARGLAGWILKRSDPPEGSLAERREAAERLEQRSRGLREQLRVAERKLEETELNAADVPQAQAAGAARLRQLLERRLDLLHQIPGVPADVRREAAYELAVCIRRGVGWLERVVSDLEAARRYVANIATACAPREGWLGKRTQRRTPESVEEEHREAERLYRAAASAAEGAQRELGLLLGVPHRSPAFEDLESTLDRPRDVHEVASLALWEMGHRIEEARALVQQYAPRLRELDDLASS